MKLSTEIFITGARGYVGSLISRILSENNIKFVPCSSNSASDCQFTLDGLFSKEISRNSLLIHCAYDFSLRAELNNLNIVSLRRLITFCEERDLQLLLISSSNAEFPNRSIYSRIKRIQEEIVLKYEKGAILRIGTVRDTSNSFLRLLKISSLLRVKFRNIDNAQIFRMTEIHQLASSLLNYLESNQKNSSRFYSYKFNDPALTFKELEGLLIAQKGSKNLSMLPLGLVISLFHPLSFVSKINRLKHSLTFIASETDSSEARNTKLFQPEF